MAHVLEKEWETYQQHRDELLAAHAGKYVLIHGDQILGIYDTKMDAIHVGHDRLGLVPILVKKIEWVDTPITFGGGLLRPNI